MACATFPICFPTHDTSAPRLSWNPFHHFVDSVTMVLAIWAPIVFTPAVAHANVFVNAFWNPSHHFGPSDTMVFAICAPMVFTPAVAHANVEVKAFWNPI